MKPQRVRGRVQVTLNGKHWIIELTADGVRVRRKRRRVWHPISIPDLIELAQGQSLIPLKP